MWEIFCFPLFKFSEGKGGGREEGGPIWIELHIDLLSKCIPWMPAVSETALLSFPETGY
jgi:hypothetical protein